MTLNKQDNRQILVTGATGYIGGRLVPRLLQAGYHVRVLIREDAARINGRSWKDQVEIAIGDVLVAETIYPALQGIHTAYYLIHGMGDQNEFSQSDVQAAENFAAAAASAGVRRIIYLGGLGDPEGDLSDHLRSRQETGDALRHGRVPVTEFRAGMIVGSGSLSFELLRNLTEQMPVIIAPPWIDTRSQPVAIRDVLHYLIGALGSPKSSGKIVEIGGADVLTYAEMIKIYARVRKLRRVIKRTESLNPNLFSYWVHWMTPVSGRISTSLIEGLQNELVVRSSSAKTLFPGIKPLDFETAVRLALERLDKGDVETWWNDTQDANRSAIKPIYLKQEQGMLVERRLMTIDAPPKDVFRAFSTLSYTRFWPRIERFKRPRQVISHLVGGAGRVLQRRLPKKLKAGIDVDFWRVEKVEPYHTLRLRFKMSLLGQGWIVFEANSRADGRTDLVQTAYFASKGLPGLVYWYGFYPAHFLIFSQMIRDIAQRATDRTQAN